MCGSVYTIPFVQDMHDSEKCFKFRKVYTHFEYGLKIYKYVFSHRRL